MNNLSRLELLIGKENIDKLKNKKVCIFGVGGVGGACALSLARSGIGNITLVDSDTVSITNLNRQVAAKVSTIGKLKVEVIKDMILDIDPNIKVDIYPIFYLPDNKDIDLLQFDYVIDCIDTISAKIFIIETCVKNNIKIISSMGAGNRLDPTKVEIMDLSKTYSDPLAKVMRYELRKRGINHLTVCFSTEDAIKVDNEYSEEGSNKKVIPASSAFVPNAFGLAIGSKVLRDLIGD